jgi:hypothetical protein
MLTPHCVRMLTAGVRTHALSPYAHNVGVSRLVAVPVPPVKVRTHLQSHGNRTTITLQSHSNHTPMARQSHSNHTPMARQWHGNGTPMALQSHSNGTPMAHQPVHDQRAISPPRKARTHQRLAIIEESRRVLWHLRAISVQSLHNQRSISDGFSRTNHI